MELIVENINTYYGLSHILFDVFLDGLVLEGFLHRLYINLDDIVRGALGQEHHLGSCGFVSCE